MRKNFGAKTYVYPMPVFIIGSYDENGVPDAMNAAWGCICDYKKIALCLDSRHKSVENILKAKALTVSIATEYYVSECDYVGIVSAHQEPHKLEKAGFHTTPSEFVNAPLVDELPMSLECQMISYDEESEMMFCEIINASADESILDDQGCIDPMKLSPLIFDPVHNTYLTIGEKVGNAFFRWKKIKEVGAIMKALASDFDGTIYFEDGFQEENTLAIQKLQSEGYLFGICTGRPLLGVTHHKTPEFTYDFYIVSSGAGVLDKDFHIIYENCVSKEIVQQIYEQFKDETKVAVQANFKIYSYEKPVEIDIDQIIIHHVDEIDGTRIYGLSLNTRDEVHARAIRQKILDEFGEELDAFQNKEYIDIVGKGCSKGVGIQKLKEVYGLEEVYGIGDSYNDLPMLETVDRSFTFTDSPDVVKDKADDVVKNIAEAIEIILKKA